MKELSLFKQTQQNVIAKDLTAFLKEAKGQGWAILGNNGNPVHRSRAGNLQIAFQNGNDRVYLRISTTIESKLAAHEPVELQKCPIYEIPITQGPNAGKTMLVIGVKGESSLTLLTGNIDFANLVIPEPAEAVGA